jgi:hypothetical protein
MRHHNEWNSISPAAFIESETLTNGEQAVWLDVIRTWFAHRHSRVGISFTVHERADQRFR